MEPSNRRTERVLMRVHDHVLDVNCAAVVAAEQLVDNVFEVRYFSHLPFEILSLPTSPANIN